MMKVDEDTVPKLMHVFSISQTAILLVLMSYFPAPEIVVYTANLRNITTHDIDLDIEPYSTAPLYLVTSAITAVFALASRRVELSADSPYTAEALQEHASWDLCFWTAMLFQHGSLISFMCSPCDWYFLLLTVAGSTLLMMLMARLPLVDPSRSRDYVIQFVALGLLFTLYTAVHRHNHMGYFFGLVTMNVLVLIGHTFDANPNMHTLGSCRLFYTAGCSVLLLSAYVQGGSI